MSNSIHHKRALNSLGLSHYSPQLDSSPITSPIRKLDLNMQHYQLRNRSVQKTPSKLINSNHSDSDDSDNDNFVTVPPTQVKPSLLKTATLNASKSISSKLINSTSIASKSVANSTSNVAKSAGKVAIQAVEMASKTVKHATETAKSILSPKKSIQIHESHQNGKKIVETITTSITTKTTKIPPPAKKIVQSSFVDEEWMAFKALLKYFWKSNWGLLILSLLTALLSTYLYHQRKSISSISSIHKNVHYTIVVGKNDLLNKNIVVDLPTLSGLSPHVTLVVEKDDEIIEKQEEILKELKDLEKSEIVIDIQESPKTLEQIEEEKEQEIELPIPEDLTSLAKIVKSRTSQTHYILSPGPISKWISRMISRKLKRPWAIYEGGKQDWILGSFDDVVGELKVGQCWGMKGNQGNILFKFSNRIKNLAGITILHPLTTSHNKTSSPKELSFYGIRVVDPVMVERQEWSLKGFLGRKLWGSWPGEDSFLLNSTTFDPDFGEYTVEFDRGRRDVQDLDGVEVRIEGNWGQDWTCLYGLTFWGNL